MKNLLTKIIIQFYRKFNFYQLELDENYQKDNSVKKIDSKILQRIKEQNPVEFTNRKYKIFEERINSDNEVGYVLIINNQIAAYAFIAVNNFYEGTSGYRATLPENTVYLFDLTTFNSFKRQGCMKRLIESIFCTYHDFGYKYARTIVSFDNKPSNSLMKSFDFHSIGTIITKTFRQKKHIKYRENNLLK